MKQYLITLSMCPTFLWLYRLLFMRSCLGIEIELREIIGGRKSHKFFIDLLIDTQTSDRSKSH